MDVVAKRQDGVLVLEIAGRLDANTAGALQERLTAEVDPQVDRLVVLDCGGVAYVSSSALRVFLVLLKSVKKQGGRVALCSLSDLVKGVFEISGLAPLFVMATGRAEAVAALADVPA